MASRVFVDTGAWFALIDPKDADHEAAVAWHKHHSQTPLVTSDYVVAELLNLLVARRQKARAPAAASWILDREAAEIHRVSPQNFDEARRVLEEYRDKSWSFTDCTSKVLMEQLGIDTAFAFDEHFRQFGTVTVVP